MRRVRWSRWAAAALVVLLVAVAAIVTFLTSSSGGSDVTSRALTINVMDGPHHRVAVRLDATLYIPARTPAPAVIISPGFGGTKNTVADQARSVARRGLVVLAYTPRGFGHSTGKIALNAPDYEVADARQLVDWLADSPLVVNDRRGDPRVGVTGESYGGALALMLAGSDPRVDTIVPVITYNDLSQALLPDSATTGDLPATPAPGAFGEHGVFKKAWAGYFFAEGMRGGGTGEPTCGRFMPRVCRAYQQVATTGHAGDAGVRLLRNRSPISVTGNITIPTMLVQGEQDTLFGLAQADANARQVAAAGGEVRMVWYAGGHNGGQPGARVSDEIGDWLQFHLTGDGDDPGTGFTYQVPGLARQDGTRAIRTVHAPAYPGLTGGHTRHRVLSLSGGRQPVLNPAGGNPAAVSSLPGIGAGLGGLASRLATDIPGEFARFGTAPLDSELLIAGAPTVRLRVDGPAGAPLFAKLYDVAPDGTRALPGAGVAAFRIPHGGGVVTVTLHGIVHSVQPGHHLELVVSSTDQGYRNATRPAVYRVAALGGLSAPVVPGNSAPAASFPMGQIIAIGVVLLLCLLGSGAIVVRRRRRHARDDREVDPELAGVPLALDGLGKTYRGGLRVVDDLSFRVERGQVLGLLGPNGAGKTTALRMLLGLVRPTDGMVRVFGHQVRPGAPVLSRIGSFVERPGFLPHLSGIANLRLHWRASGRPAAQAHMREALDIADLGDAVHRKVGTYSLGMRQRLAVAQAMLGMPELLVLDEPTNGLDPPQIRDTRDMLLRYADTGRTVLVSSHVLAEVEQTCSHAVVMNRGRLIASGTVADLVTVGNESEFTVDDPARALDVLSTVDGLDALQGSDHVISARLTSTGRADVVATLVAAGIRVEQASPRGRLEDAFLRLVEEEANS